MSGRLAQPQGGGLPDAVPPDVLATTFPALLKQAGYRVGIVGKWGVGGPPPKEHSTSGTPGAARVSSSTPSRARGEGSQLRVPRAAGREVYQRHAGRTAVLPRLAVQVAARAVPARPARRRAVQGRQIVPPKTATTKTIEKLPPNSSKSLATCGPSATSRRRKYQEFVKQYFRCIAGVDRSVGLSTKLLDDKKRSDNTVLHLHRGQRVLLG